MCCWGHSLGSTDPRDRIYSLLALVRKSELQQIVVDYSEFNPPERVFSTTIVLLLECYGPDILTRCERLCSPSLQIPSWVPDWTGEISSNTYDNGYMAAGTSSMEAREMEKAIATGALALSGICVDIIDRIGPGSPVRDDLRSEECDLQGLRGWLAEEEELLSKENNLAYQTRDRIDEALWRTPIANRFRERKVQHTDKYGYLVLRGVEVPPMDYSERLGRMAS